MRKSCLWPLASPVRPSLLRCGNCLVFFTRSSSTIALTTSQVLAYKPNSTEQIGMYTAFKIYYNSLQDSDVLQTFKHEKFFILKYF